MKLSLQTVCEAGKHHEPNVKLGKLRVTICLVSVREPVAWLGISRRSPPSCFYDNIPFVEA